GFDPQDLVPLFSGEVPDRIIAKPVRPKLRDFFRGVDAVERDALSQVLDRKIVEPRRNFERVDHRHVRLPREKRSACLGSAILLEADCNPTASSFCSARRIATAGRSISCIIFVPCIFRPGRGGLRGCAAPPRAPCPLRTARVWWLRRRAPVESWR